MRTSSTSVPYTRGQLLADDRETHEMDRLQYAKYFMKSIYVDASFIGSRGKAFKDRNQSVKSDYDRHNDEYDQRMHAREDGCYRALRCCSCCYCCCSCSCCFLCLVVEHAQITQLDSELLSNLKERQERHATSTIQISHLVEDLGSGAIIRATVNVHFPQFHLPVCLSQVQDTLYFHAILIQLVIFRIGRKTE